MAVTWNASDKSANITLSGGNLTATTTSATQGAVRATASASSGKVYVEYQIAVLAGSAYALGWANSTMSLATAMGTTTNSVVFEPSSGTGTTLLNNVSLGSMGYVGFALLTVCQAFDITNKLIWTKYNNGLWNGSSTANPATGTGGFSTSTLSAGPYFPVFAANGSGASCIAYFGATDFNYPVPSGFSGLDTNVQTYNGSSKFLGYTLLDPPQGAAVASKFVGYGLLDPPQNAAVASKFVAYAILQPAPSNFRRIDWDFPPPKLPLVRPTIDATGVNPNLFPPTPVPVFNPLESIPRLRIFRDEAYLGSPLSLLSAAQPVRNLYGDTFVSKKFDRTEYLGSPLPLQIIARTDSINISILW